VSQAQITLYSTDGCHLCELAAQQLVELEKPFITVDIIDDSALVNRYGLTIPVIARSDNSEINWPFDVQQLASFLE